MKRLFAVMALTGLALGCARPPQEETIEVGKVDPMLQVQSTLQNYARGQPLASEVTSFDYMVEEVRKVDPAKAEILKAGLEDLKKTKGSPAAKAKALLTKLGLEQPPKQKVIVG